MKLSTKGLEVFKARAKQVIDLIFSCIVTETTKVKNSLEIAIEDLKSNFLITINNVKGDVDIVKTEIAAVKDSVVALQGTQDNTVTVEEVAALVEANIIPEFEVYDATLGNCWDEIAAYTLQKKEELEAGRR